MGRGVDALVGVTESSVWVLSQPNWSTARKLAPGIAASALPSAEIVSTRPLPWALPRPCHYPATLHPASVHYVRDANVLVGVPCTRRVDALRDKYQTAARASPCERGVGLSGLLESIGAGYSCREQTSFRERGELTELISVAVQHHPYHPDVALQLWRRRRQERGKYPSVTHSAHGCGANSGSMQSIDTLRYKTTEGLDSVIRARHEFGAHPADKGTTVSGTPDAKNADTALLRQLRRVASNRPGGAHDCKRVAGCPAPLHPKLEMRSSRSQG